MKSEKWWSEGVRFECQGSGRCCVSRDSYGLVYLTLEDRRRLAAELQLSLRDFTRQYCKRDMSLYYLDDRGSKNCIFLRGKQCGVYNGRPTQCRTWPFWPEVMNARTWKKEVSAFCPGIGKGRLWTAEEIQGKLNEQMLSETELKT